MRKIILAAMIAGLATTASAGSKEPMDNGSTAGIVILLAIGAVVALSGGIGASASETRKDKVADEE